MLNQTIFGLGTHCAAVKKRKKRTAATNKGCKVLLTIPKAINTRS